MRVRHPSAGHGLTRAATAEVNPHANAPVSFFVPDLSVPAVFASRTGC
jgi:hypothetical protein